MASEGLFAARAGRLLGRVGRLFRLRRKEHASGAFLVASLLGQAERAGGNEKNRNEAHLRSLDEFIAVRKGATSAGNRSVNR